MKFLLIALLASPLAQAGTLNCQDMSGQRLTYSYWQPDGGAASGPREALHLDGEVMIQINPLKPEDDIRNARFSVDEKAGKVILKTESEDKKFDLVAFVAKARVKAIDGIEEAQPLLYDRLVLCERAIYKGPMNIP